MHGYRYPRTRRRAGRSARDDRLHADLRVARSQPADEAGLARRYHRGRCLSVADPAPLRRSGRSRARPGVPPACSCSRTAASPTRRRLPGQGRDPVGPGGRHRRHGARPRSAAGFDKIIGFDMGGTSTDVSHFAGEYEREFETEVAGVRIRAPMMSIHTVAAGGGSICSFDGARFRVGPRIGGRESRPGLLPARRPADGDRLQRACSARSSRDYFPAVFGPKARPAARSRRSSRDEFDGARRRRSQRRPGSAATPEEIAEGFSRSPSATWRTRSSRSRCSAATTSREYALCCFGGAGGQHACLVADALGMTRVFMHPLAGVLSAYGMGLADRPRMRERALELPLDEALAAAIERISDALADDAARAECCEQGVAADTHPDRATCASALRRHRHRASRSRSGDARRRCAQRVRSGAIAHASRS